MHRLPPVLLVCALAPALLNGCAVSGIGSSVGRGAASGGLTYLRSDQGREALRALADSSAVTVASAVRTRIQPTVDSAVVAVLDRGRAAIDQARDSLATAIRTDISSALQDLVRANLATTGLEGRRQTQLLLASASGNLDQELAPALQRSVVRVTDALIMRLTDGLRSQLGAAAETVVVRSVRGGVKAGDQSARGSSTWKTVRFALIGFVVALVLLALVWLYSEVRRSHAALSVVTGEINRRGDESLKLGIKEGARAKGVEGWLHSFLEKNQ
jgi:hypothetical protein